jgi:hypothetical protein
MEAGNYVEYVHALSVRLLNSVFRRGEHLWNSRWHHVHVALVAFGKWARYLDYMRRDIELWWLKKGQKHPVWTSWSTYPDLHLPPLPNIINSEMVKLQKKISCKVIATVKLNIRETPSTSAKVVGQVDPQTLFETDVVASGTSVDGNSTWYQFLNGYISGKFVEEMAQGDLTALQEELHREKVKNSELTAQNSNLTTTVAQYKPGYDAAKLIQNTQ